MISNEKLFKAVELFPVNEYAFIKSNAVAE